MREVQYRGVRELRGYPGNARVHSPEQVEQIAASIRRFGFTNPILVDEWGELIAGHGRLEAAERVGLERVPVIVLDGLTPEQRRAYVLADNKLAENAGWNEELLAAELRWLSEADFDLALTGFSDEEIAELLGPEVDDWDGEGDGLGDGEGDGGDDPAGAEPPFLGEPSSILNAREGWWAARKEWWIESGIRSEVGRDAACLADIKTFKGKEAAEGSVVGIGVSIFDPVLCEAVYRWLCPGGGVVLDPFAGGSVRGVVASRLGRRYVGHELRAEQVEANREQAVELCADDPVPPVWIEGDSRMIDRTCADLDVDLVFSCPPYADLEVYSDDPRDLSGLAYADFIKAYREIIAKACARLRPDRFACFVVGDVRGKDGAYYGFVPDTIRAFEDAGLRLYSSAVLVTMVANTSLTVSRNFPPGRKLGKTHQNVLIFVKGDPRVAEAACFEG